MPDSVSSDPTSEPLLTKDEVASLLGVTTTWLDSEIQSGRISHLRLGRRKFIRFRREHISEYLAERERPAKIRYEGETTDHVCSHCDCSADTSPDVRVVPPGEDETTEAL